MACVGGKFLGLPAEWSDPRRAGYVVLPVPYEGTVTWAAGTAAGPAAIIAASDHIEWFDEELRADFYRAGIATADPIPPADTPQEQARRVRAAAEGFFQEGKFLLALGGEHGITPSLVAAAAGQHDGLSVLQIDAHADLRDEYEHGPLSHACVMRRVLEVTDRLAQVGIRSFCREAFEQCPRQVADFITPQTVAEDPGWIEKVLDLLGEKVYVTIDMDGFDPAEAPGVGTPQPGGLHYADVLRLLRRVCTERQVVAADIVETRPIPPSNTTELLAARLACKIIAYTQC